MSKIVFCGDGGVGKTTLIKKILINEFEQRYVPTLGVEVHPIDIGTKKFTVWDVAGQEKYSLGYDQLFENASKVVIFYDSTSSLSFKNINFWERKIPPQCSDIIYVRTKCDISRNINKHIQEEICISTKNNTNLLSIFK